MKLDVKGFSMSHGSTTNVSCGSTCKGGCKGCSGCSTTCRGTCSGHCTGCRGSR